MPSDDRIWYNAESRKIPDRTWKTLRFAHELGSQEAPQEDRAAQVSQEAEERPLEEKA